MIFVHYGCLNLLANSELITIPVIFLIMIKFLIVVETIKKEKEFFINISILSGNIPVNHANPNLEIPPRAK